MSRLMLFNIKVWQNIETYCNDVFYRKLFATIDANDDNYMPHRIIVMGGELDTLHKLNDLVLEE